MGILRDGIKEKKEQRRGNVRTTMMSKDRAYTNRKRKKIVEEKSAWKQTRADKYTASDLIHERCAEE